MRLIKLALISIVLLFAMATLFSLLIPSNIRISKAINIGASRDSVLELVKNRERWKEWHPAYLPGDSARKFASIRFNTITQNDSAVVMELSQGDKQPVINGWNVYVYQGVDSVTLQWYMDFHLKWYPWQKMGSLFYENTYGILMQEGLDQLKKRAESGEFADKP
ncbi:MAG: hypothetical protein ACXWV0_05860 [Flavisolibacter sp.]